MAPVRIKNQTTIMTHYSMSVMAGVEISVQAVVVE